MVKVQLCFVARADCTATVESGTAEERSAGLLLSV